MARALLGAVVLLTLLAAGTWWAGEQTEVAVLRTSDGLGRGDETTLWVVDREGVPWVRVAHPERAADAADRERYQTVFARAPGAVAAPTAGLHFDLGLFDALAARRVERTFLTLHVGAGTFAPVRTERVEDHELHAEWLEVSAAVCASIERCRERGGRVVAVGTTTVRALETAARGGKLAPFAGDSRLFIYPGFEFRVVDAMVTNFHLPESSLLMLVAAFAGREQTLAAYRHAVAQRYRFFSYGDAMFVSPKARA